MKRASTMLMLLPGFVWAFEFIKGRRKRFAYVIDSKIGENARLEVTS